VIHFHGTPITPRAELLKLAGRNFCVSFAEPRDIAICHQIGQSVLLDNGAYSIWRAGGELDLDYYAEWVAPWLDHRTTWCVIPDKIDGTDRDNDLLLARWSELLLPAAQCAPVWHLHEPLERLCYLCAEYPRVCLGSSGDYATVGDPRWHRRMVQAMNAVCGDGPAPCWLHMLRGLSLAGSDYPFASADSTNLAQNHKGNASTRRVPARDIRQMADQLDSRQCAPRWRRPPAQYALCETCGGSGTVECGTMHPGWCDSDPCHGHCEVACNDCTGDGMVLA
jgi:hypothetical protein